MDWVMAAIWKDYRWVAFAEMPYLLGLATATMLQLSISVTNWGRA